VKTGDVVPAGTMIMRLTSYDSEGYGAESLPSQDKYGQDTGRTEVLTDAVLTQDKIHPELGYADVKYVDYDPQK
jgi:hypothetical protein